MPDYNETKAMGLSDITRFHKSGSSVGGGGGAAVVVGGLLLLFLDDGRLVGCRELFLF